MEDRAGCVLWVWGWVREFGGGEYAVVRSLEGGMMAGAVAGVNPDVLRWARRLR